jgi:hypothetical protein
MLEHVDTELVQQMEIDRAQAQKERKKARDKAYKAAKQEQIKGIIITSITSRLTRKNCDLQKLMTLRLVTKHTKLQTLITSRLKIKHGALQKQMTSRLTRKHIKMQKLITSRLDREHTMLQNR